MIKHAAQMFLVLALLCCNIPIHAGEEKIVLHPGAHHDLVASRCAICHSLDYVQSNAAVMTRLRWQATVHKMIDKFGAPVSDPEAALIIEYLERFYTDDAK